MIDAEKYNRSIPVNCSTCGGTEFSSDDAAPDDDSKIFTCSGCARVMTKNELLEANSHSVQLHIDDIKKQAIKDIEKQLQNALKGFGRK